jgi:hypothetical protein
VLVSGTTGFTVTDTHFLKMQLAIKRVLSIRLASQRLEVPYTKNARGTL